MKRTCSILMCVLVAVLLSGCFSSSMDGQKLARYRPRTGDRSPWSSKIASDDSAESSEPSVSGSPQTNKPVVENPDSPRENGYRSSRPLRRGDRIYISLLGIPDERKEPMVDVVDDEGNIVLPLIGTVRIEGSTTSEAERVIKKKYVEDEYYTKINVIVVAQVEEYFVGGEVNKVGKYPLAGNLTLLQAIMEAGDFTEFADHRKIKIIRGKEVLHFDGKKIRQRKDEDPVVKPDDIIMVPKRWW